LVCPQLDRHYDGFGLGCRQCGHIDFGEMDPPLVNYGDTIGFVSGGQSSTTTAADFSVMIQV
jgi:hypothetical protein